MDYSSLVQQYRSALLDNAIPFWERHSIDHKFGGFFTCLNRDGSVFDTDKFVWLQARQIWTFSILYNRVEQNSKWLDIARHGVDFLHKHGTDSSGNWYFALDRTGRPLIQPYNIFSDCFAAMAFSQFALASGDDFAADLAKKTFYNIQNRRLNPKGIYNKQVPGSRPMKGFAFPMILTNLMLELEHLLPAKLIEDQINIAIQEILEEFLDPETLIIKENISTNGESINSFDGRLLNPGHAIESMWFLMDIGKRRGDFELINKAVDVALSMLKLGWDQDYDGIFYFLDRLGYPLQQLEWDQKLWWVHLETLVALSMGYALTRRSECWEWYLRVHSYTWSHFPDPVHGEWFGYLNRRGEVLLPLKGGKWKGCFHVPRAFLYCWKIFEEVLELDI